MSLTLDHGPRPLNTIHMYPFFRPAPQLGNDNDCPPRPDTQVPPPEAVVRTAFSTQAEQLGPCIPGTATPVHHGPNRAVDSDPHRRKHRRITSNRDTAPICDTRTTGHEDFLREEPYEAQSSFTVNVNGSSASKSLSSSSPFACVSDAPPVSKPQQLTINPSPAKPRVAPQSSDGHNEPAPEKKMLCLSANGKLFRSRGEATSDSNIKPRSASNRKLLLKNGRIVPSRRVILHYSHNAASGELSIGERIDRILSSPRHATKPSDLNRSHASEANPQPTKVTHPFFLRTARVSVPADNELKEGESTTEKGSDCESAAESKPPKPWSAIQFSSSKLTTSKDVSTLQALWPPLSSQYHGHPLPHTAVDLSIGFYTRTSKQKHERVFVPSSEDILYRYRDTLCQTPRHESGPVTVPQPLSMMPKDLLTVVQSLQYQGFKWLVTHSALQSRKRQLLYSQSSFDRGLPAGPYDWAHKHAPTKTEEVLQPCVSQLAAWLRKMKVHNVQSGLPVTEDRPKKVRRKAQAKKRHDDLDDFIASSDESVPDLEAPKNAILICGPHGCGKTAAVYAVASELDFEVFELHPGMRRSAKDIFDRVGDMTANHLVQPSAPLRRPRATPAAETDNTGDKVEDSPCHTPQNMASFFKALAKRKIQQAQSSDNNRPGEEKGVSSQKQSLILLEEVDVLFEEDKSFWSGVQSLIQQSKRPIVMTCNHLGTLPLETLPLHAILGFEKPPIDDAVEYLAHVAALEGHLLDRSTLATLYQSRGRDLRGALMDLNFWCQMTVGSKVGGLDWIPTNCHSTSVTKEPQPRVISCGTFQKGLNLMPEKPSTFEDMLAFAQDQLGIPFLETAAYNPSQGGKASLAELDEACAVSDARSCVDIADPQFGAILTTAASEAFPGNGYTNSTGAVVPLVCDRMSRPEPLSRKEVTLRLYPIMDDPCTFPAPCGRTSVCIDGMGCSVATEVAPYVRSIVAFDQQLQQRRFELSGGVQGAKQRTTRAARAAQEGSDKSNTRRERWFPRELDYDAVLQTRPRLLVGAQFWLDSARPAT